ncbi:hypothetical protein H6F86_03985 [Phormidium sp. FACHB-592]|uniref:Uncharacterized protein n=1 Tax=Stenomitos frigidus AS-A4 TaxID=2933935 RepID=A0ABV0KXA0_9CYAN|nr:hypothetical protein [Phormidium sp. FACHB-592]MBD2073059.1 hypothetical protein [Phormidium sp. FACHB-592]
MTQQNILAAAKQGNPQAITALMNRSLAAQGVTAKAQLTDQCLHVMLEAEFAPNQPAMVAYVTKGVRGLKAEVVQRLVIYGRQHGADFPAWTEPVELQPLPLKVQPTTNVETFREPVVEQVVATATTPSKATAPSLLSENTARSKPVKQKLPWYETDSKSIIIALLVLFFPLGLWSMWKHGHWSLKTKGLITGMFVLLLLVHGRSEQTPSPVSSTPPAAASAPSPTQTETTESQASSAPPAAAQAQQQQSKQAAQPILNAIRKKYGYSRFIDTWGMGTQGLFLPDNAWTSLAENQKQVLIEYAQSRGLTAIVVGGQLPNDSNAISLDRTVWGE